MLHFFTAFDDDLRRDALEQMESQLSVAGEIGALGAQTPASYGMFSRRLRPSSRRAPRSVRQRELEPLPGQARGADFAGSGAGVPALPPAQVVADRREPTLLQAELADSGIPLAWILDVGPGHPHFVAVQFLAAAGALTGPRAAQLTADPKAAGARLVVLDMLNPCFVGPGVLLPGRAAVPLWILNFYVPAAGDGHPNHQMKRPLSRTSRKSTALVRR
ncbi:hypothetical protein ABZ565_04315 [Streptomyces sp. NPDC016469]|uniref:hypothetical protein n=1 Tax=Streptomyces sp. NPDC016469 TaxID=3157191 RepID=UPI0033EAE191